METQLGSLAAIVVGSLVIIGLERVRPYDRDHHLFREGLFTDLVAYGVLQSWVMGLLIAALISALDARSGLSRLRLVSDWPLAAQIGLFVVSHDLYIYGFHRLQHRVAFLWRLHEAHHSARHVDWIAGARSHPLEILVNQTVEFAPIVLLGAAPEVAVWKGVISALWGEWIHANIGVRTGVLRYVINGPEMHRWHHATDLPPPGSNFGTKLAIWDWIFGTAYLPVGRPSGYGLEADFPRSWVGQFLAAFRRTAPQAAR